MAISCGFFNSKGLDRVYSAEDFTEYLSSLICNGVLDTYGDMFEVRRKSDTEIEIGTGKAWIKGHYIVNNEVITKDMQEFVDHTLERWVTIGICCDTSEDVRNCHIVYLPGEPGLLYSPSFVNDENHTYLTLATIYVWSQTSGYPPVRQEELHDSRSDENVCGYVKCILGKCRITEELEYLKNIYKDNIQELELQIKSLTNHLSDNDTAISELNKNISELGTTMATEINSLSSKLDAITDIIKEKLDYGQCGDSIFYSIQNDNLSLQGDGATYSYVQGKSPFCGKQSISVIIINDGITKLGDYLFEDCGDLDTTIIIPPSVTTLGNFVFYNSLFSEIVIPESVTSIGEYLFNQNVGLEKAEINSVEMGDYMFSNCTALSELIIGTNVKKLGTSMFGYCASLTAITYKGAKSQWNGIRKPDNWNCVNEGLNMYMQRVNCTDGVLIFNVETKIWEVES